MSSDRYPFREIEAKWQAAWETSKQFRAVEDPQRPKFYCLEMFPYPPRRIREHLETVELRALRILDRAELLAGLPGSLPLRFDLAEGIAVGRHNLSVDIYPIGEAEARKRADDAGL